MRITASNNKKTLHISHNDWLLIGEKAGWIKTSAKSSKSRKKTMLLKEERKNAHEFAENVRKELKIRGHEVSSIKEIRGGKIGIQLVDGYRIGIEVKPWASQNNKNLEWRSGIRVIVGSGVDKYFRRKMVSKNVEKICNYVEKILCLYGKKEDRRLRRQEVADQKREEKVEQIKIQRELETTIKTVKEAKHKQTEKDIIREDIDISEDISSEMSKKRVHEQEWIDLFTNGNEDDKQFLNQYLLSKEHPFSFGSRSFFFYDPHSDYIYMPLNDVNSISELEQVTGLFFVNNLRKKNFIKLLYDIDYGILSPTRKGKFIWIMEEPIAKSQGKNVIEWGSSSSKDQIPDAVRKHIEREQIAYEIQNLKNFEEHKEKQHQEERRQIKEDYEKRKAIDEPHQIEELLHQVASSKRIWNIDILLNY